MTLRGRRVDANHAAIVQVLRQLNCAVLDLSRLGHDVPDLAVWRRGEVWMVEVKNKAARGAVSSGQELWMTRWPGPSVVLWSAEEAAEWALGRATCRTA